MPHGRKRGEPKRLGDLFESSSENPMTDPFPGETLLGGEMGVDRRGSPNREDQFERETGRFRGPDGQFESGSPPPDLDQDAERYRGNDGRFKKGSADLFDEPEEVRLDSLDPKG